MITPGEPAGIGPELLLAIARQPWQAELVAICDPGLLRNRATDLGLAVAIETIDLDAAPEQHGPGYLSVHPVPMARPSIPGELDEANSEYVLETLRQASALCLSGRADALVTGPVQKSIINQAGHAFSGHTEFLAELSNAAHPVMMLATSEMRVALATTHLPLRKVAGAIHKKGLRNTIRVLVDDLQGKFSIDDPRILVCGLNPHAGEDGYLGDEELKIIAPVMDEFRSKGVRLVGPLPADTLFTSDHLDQADAVLAMYHDQGLPVLKYAGFGQAVNITLGLPIIRTSVDHGTALDLAGSGNADPGSFEAAVETAIRLASTAAAGRRD